MSEPLVHQSFADWIHDDITWCSETDCPIFDCMRNQCNRRSKDGLFSVAMLAGTEYCLREHIDKAT